MNHVKLPPMERETREVYHPHRGIFQVNDASAQSCTSPLDYDRTLWMVVGWSNGWAECSTKMRKDQVLVAKMIFDLRPDLNEFAPSTCMYRFSDKWLEGSGWGTQVSLFSCKPFWPLPQSRADDPHPTGESVQPQPYLCLDVLYEVPLDILEETFSADGLRCECAVDDFNEVEKAIAKKGHFIWSEQRGYFKA